MSNPVILIPETPGNCIADPNELVTLVTGAALAPTVGVVIDDATAPDVITYPSLERALWIDRSGPTVVVRHWDPVGLSWVGPVIEPNSITGDMIVDYTITLDKLDPTGGTGGYVLRLNPGGTEVIYDDTQNLFTSSNRLNVNVLSLPAAGTWILQSNGTTNSWGSLTTLVQSVTINVSQISTSGAADPSVLSYVGGTLAYRTVNASTADNTIALARIQNGPASNIAATNSGGTATEWITPSSLYNLLAPYITAGGYVTPEVNQVAIPATGTAQSFTHGLGGTPRKFGGFVVCTDAGGDGTYNEGDVIDWLCLYDVNGDQVINYSVNCDGTSVILVRTNAGSGAMYVVAKDGTSANQLLDDAKWECGAWAQSS